jgi:very-short-patch-repair endonuclease
VAKVASEAELWHFVHRHGGGDHAAAWIAGRQLGVITVAQLEIAGLGRRAVARRCERGLLYRVHRGVYLWGCSAVPAGAAELAAQFAAGPEAYVSHRSAAALWGFVTESASATVDVTVVGAHHRSRAGLRVHRVAKLSPADRDTRRGIAVTAPARTLLDLAADAGNDELERALSEAYAQRLISEPKLLAALARAPNRSGVAALTAQIRSGPALVITRSKAERMLRALVREAGLPTPLMNVRIEGYTVDAFWPQQRLVVEFDGYTTHGHRRAFERDRRRDAALVAAGYRVIRVTWRQLTEQPLLVVANIARALEWAV